MPKQSYLLSFFFMIVFIVVVNGSNDGIAAPVEPASKDCGQMEVRLQRFYLDGESSEEVRIVSNCLLEDVLKKYDDWDLVNISNSKAILQKHIDDLSPLLKTNGYFGITDDGILTIFEGSPEHEKAIQSFYQLDTKKLESRMMQQLQSGIPIQSKDHYLHVMNQLQQYAIK